jgi:DNA-binding response OmpR family regulator
MIYPDGTLSCSAGETGGTDDYVAMPFGPNELVAPLRAIPGVDPAVAAQTLRCGNVTMDL